MGWTAEAVDKITANLAHNPSNNTMSSNVGLTTPRGSGTSGYVQRNMSLLRTRDNASQPYSKDVEPIGHRQRQPDQEMLEHERQRAIEVKVFELQDKLEDEGRVGSCES